MTKVRGALWLLFLLASTKLLTAEDYPTHFVKVIHGFPVGGNVDVLARISADEMSRGLGQPIIIEARPGVVGSLAAESVARAAPDGYTLLFLPSAHAVTAAVYKSIKYNAVDDFAWISTISFYPFVLCVPKDSKIKSLQDLLQEARSRPNGVVYGSTGVGSIHYMTIELMANASQTKFINVSYRGEAQILTAMLGGDIEFGATTVTVAAPQIESGAVRPIAVTSRHRWRDLPDVPTFDEAGLPGFEVVSWSGYAAPAGTPRTIINRLNSEVQRAIGVPEIKQHLEKLGGEARGTTPEEMRSLVAEQVALWTKLAKDRHMEIP